MFNIRPVVLDAIAVPTLPNGIPVSTLVVALVTVAVVVVITILLIRHLKKRK